MRAAEGIRFVLGHALAMKAIHGSKSKNDKIDSHKIAHLLRGGLLPESYVYPAAMRSTRDLLRRRLHLVRKRGQLLAHHIKRIAVCELERNVSIGSIHMTHRAIAQVDSTRERA